MSIANPLISVIIPTYSRPRQLKDCLDALTRQTCESAGFEVIVVDDGGQDPLDNLIHSYKGKLEITLTRQNNAGAASARNAGVAQARGEMLAFTDDDCLPNAAWLSELAEAHRYWPDEMLGGSVVNTYTDNPYAEASQLILDCAYSFYNENPADARFFASCNMAMPVHLFHTIGGFETRFRIASEDRELCDRWHWKGYKLRFVPAAIVQHARPLTFATYIRQHFNYGRGAFQLHRVRSARGYGGLIEALKGHGRLLRTLSETVARRPARQTTGIYGLLGLWQVINTAGFLYAGLFRSPPPRRRA